jgi:hypothetical protein
MRGGEIRREREKERDRLREREADSHLKYFQEIS